MAAQVFENMLGRSMTQIEGCAKGSDSMTFYAYDGSRFRFDHQQDCCEQVTIEDIIGDMADLIGSPLIEAEEVSTEGQEPKLENEPESYTWTFYKFSTAMGSVTVRWLGASNGYYSERVDFTEELAK